MTDQPLYRKVYDAIRREIESGKIAPGEKIPPVRELCRTLNVSHITVMRGCRELSAAGIIVPRGTLGFYAAERGNYISQTRRLGLLLRPFSSRPENDPYFDRINAGLAGTLCHEGYSLLLSPENRLLDRMILTGDEEALLTRRILLLQQECDGIFIDERLSDNALEKILKEQTKPWVIVNRSTALPLTGVTPPNKEGMQALLQFAGKLDYRVWVYVSGNLLFRNELERKEIFENFTKKARQETDLLSGVTVNGADKSCDRIRTLLKKYQDRKVLFITPTDYIGRNVADFLGTLGVKWGQEAGLVSFEGLDLARKNFPGLTTVAYSPRALGELAARKMLEQICRVDLRKESENVTLPFDLQIGDTL